MICRKYSIILLFIIISISSGISQNISVQNDSYGALSNNTGNPIGGGENYNDIILDHDFHVRTRNEFLNAIKVIKPGQSIYISDTAKIDLSGYQNIRIPPNCILASGRGYKGSEGALLYSDSMETLPLFLIYGENVRITGLRLKGPDMKRRTEQMKKLNSEKNYYSLPNSRCIETYYARLEVDNCEIYGWSHAAISLNKGGYNSHIHHNYIHHNQRHGLGYGVLVNKCNALIEANVFDYCRHHINGSGYKGTSYEARFNQIKENSSNHNFDMHSIYDSKEKMYIAGDKINIHHNTFMSTSYPAVQLRGKPNELAEIHHNLFYHKDQTKAVSQINNEGNMSVFKNKYNATEEIDIIFSSCQTPANIKIQNLTATKALIEWDSVFHANSYEIKYKPKKGSTKYISTTQNKIILVDLLPDTEYIWYIKTNCSADSSDFQWIPEEFKTFSENCGCPDQLKIEKITEGSLLKWKAVDGAKVYYIKYRPKGSEVFIYASSKTNSFIIKKLKAKTSYEVYVRAICNKGQSGYQIKALEFNSN